VGILGAVAILVVGKGMGRRSQRVATPILVVVLLVSAVILVVFVSANHNKLYLG
jgi:hypothetical protein